MKKSDLINVVAERLNEKEENVTLVLETIVEEIASRLRDGEDVKIHGFGKFEARAYGKRNCYNPQTGEIIILPESVQPAFVPGGKFRLMIQKQKRY